MGKEPRTTPRVVCVAIPIYRAVGKVLMVTSRKRPEQWVCEWERSFRGWILIWPAIFLVPKGGWEAVDSTLEEAALREAFEEG